MNRVGDSLIHNGENKALVEAFVSREVQFLVVGGLAVAWYVATREADDMDLLLNPTEQNSVRVSQALGSLGLQGLLGDSFARLGLQVPLKQHLYAELLTPLKDSIAYAEMERVAFPAKLFGIPVRLASPASLIHMKQTAVAAAVAQSEKHRKDIELLEPHVV